MKNVFLQGGVLLERNILPEANTSPVASTVLAGNLLSKEMQFLEGKHNSDWRPYFPKTKVGRNLNSRGETLGR